MKARLVSLDYHVPQCNTSLNAFPVIIGHAPDAGIRLDDPSIAERHCEINADEDGLTVSDLDTVHGTFVNSARVTQSILQPGDELAVGMMTFLVEPAEEADENFEEFAEDTTWERAETVAVGKPR